LWWADYTARGTRVRASTGIEGDNKGKGKREAADWLKQRTGEARTSNIAPSADKITLVELVETYLDDREDDSVVYDRKKWQKHLAPFFGNIKAVELTKDLFRAYINHRRAQDSPANGTINRELSIVSAALNAACEEGKIRTVPPFPSLKEADPRPGFLKDDEYDRLVNETAKVGLWMRSILECGYQYGWRLHELIPDRIENTNQFKGGLRVSQCDFDNRIILLNPGETKNGAAREAPMVGQVEILLRVCCAGKAPGDYVFTRPDGKPVLWFRTEWKRVCNRAGVPGLLFHDLRRTGRRNMALAGIPDDTALKIGGWKTDSVAKRYNIQGRDMTENARRKMEAYRQQQAEVAQLRHKTPDLPNNLQSKQQVN
jgi:integrase